MKVLFLVPDLFGPPGGIARYCRLVVRALTETSGVSVDVLALHDQPQQPDIRYLRGTGWTYTAFASRRAQFSRCAIKAVICGGYDLLVSGHVNFTPLLHVVPFRRETRIVFVYGIDAWHRLPWHRRWAVQRSSRIIAISQHTADLAGIANRLPPEKIRILHNCLDPALDPSDSLSAAAEDQRGLEAPRIVAPSILTVARMWQNESSKGHDGVIRALPRVKQQVPDAQYYVVGEGDQRESLEALAREIGVGASVHFLGRLSDAELKRCYEACTLFAMPSKTEGFGFVFLEAMAHARPVLASTVDAGPEVIGDNEAGLLVDPDDTAQIAEAIQRVLSDPQLQRKLGEAGRARVSNLFTYDGFKRNLLHHLVAASSNATVARTGGGDA